jgi:hypothetical protein
MRTAWERMVCVLAGSVALLALGACGLVSDALAPGLAQQIGLDPASIKPQQGTVMVAFNNTTRYPATFFAYLSVDATDLTRSSRNFSADIAAGKVGNEVLDCPVGLISPGALDSAFSPSGVAASVAGVAGSTTALAEVAYTGNPVISGSSFSCGDVIEIRLAAGGTTESPTFAITVRVIPGS